jgi:hypothetical protein
MLTREAVAAALALAGIRTGAHVLDLAPDAGLTRAARAMAGSGGRVDTVEEPVGVPPVRYGYAIGVWSDRPASEVVHDVAGALPELAQYARVTVGSSGSLSTLVDRLRSGGWTVLHATTVPDADPALGRRGELALAVARRAD